MPQRFIRFRRRAWIAALAAILVSVSAGAQSPPPAGTKAFLWTVESRGQVAYLAGSIHALSADVYPLAAVFEKAFASAGTLVEEVDLSEVSKTNAPALLARGMYQDGRTVEQAVSKDTVALLAQHAQTLGLPLQLLRTMKPWMIALTLTGLQVVKAGLDPALGLDKHFYDRAVAGRKTVIGLETAESQIARLDGLPELVQERLLVNTLEELEAQPVMLKEIVTAWKRGDAAYFEKSIVDSFREYPEAYRSLIVERNRAWLGQIESCLSRSAPCFIVVGAAHLVGPDGVPALLRERGYTVVQQ
jgi:uncharacterized protein